MLHAITYLELRPQTLAPALDGVERWLGGEGRDGTLIACWYASLGPANRVLVWRGFDDHDGLIDAQLRVAASADPYGVGEHLAGLDSNVFHEIDFVGPPARDVEGPLFEVRDYVLKLDRLPRLLDLWRDALPARLALAPWMTALFALSGAAPRVLHIYPWPNLERRNAIRDSARSVGWPPPEAPQQIDWQESTIYRAAACSPVQ